MLVRSGVGAASGDAIDSAPWYCSPAFGVGPLLFPSCRQAYAADAGTIAASATTSVASDVSKGVKCGFFGGQLMSDGSCYCDPSDIWCNYGVWVVGAAAALFLYGWAFGGRR